MHAPFKLKGLINLISTPAIYYYYVKDKTAKKIKKSSSFLIRNMPFNSKIMKINLMLYPNDYRMISPVKSRDSLSPSCTHQFNEFYFAR